jgi:rubrerythrin
VVTDVIEGLADRLSDRSPYVCEFCDVGYDRNRDTCPACGFAVVSR